FAGLVKSNLEVPQPIAKFLSLYLLMALGLKGGFALSESTVGVHVVLSITLALVLAFLIPVVGYWLLKRFTNSFDAAAMAAS
ncbi:sodium-dependent bicarbonate transport family permease, partial [Klebsiella pneumoniae]|uniref:sodium-dependent bicarbonate transport family permease n=2 Tax=Pseudomonadota TaxID=1224 RepID=UPI00254D7FFE